jgi:hypothetical protein
VSLNSRLGCLGATVNQELLERNNFLELKVKQYEQELQQHPHRTRGQHPPSSHPPYFTQIFQSNSNWRTIF